MKQYKWPIPKFPVRATIITFLALSSLFAVTAPFMPDIPRITYFLAGVAYSAFLAVLGVGICLRGPKAGGQLKIIMLVCLLLCLAIFLPLVYGMLTHDYSSSLAISSVANRLGLWLGLALFIAMLIIASLGWKQHFQKDKSPNKGVQAIGDKSPQPDP